MEYTLTQGYFSTKEEALAEIAARGWHALEYDAPAQEDELHWHDYDSVAFVLGGTCRIVFEDGNVMECGAGARIEQPSHVLHRSIRVWLQREPARNVVAHLQTGRRVEAPTTYELKGGTPTSRQGTPSIAP